MTLAYYNDHDPDCAAWLRRLVKRDAIPRGYVDAWDVERVTPADLAGFTQCHFFAGIGGWPYALRLAGWPDSLPVWTASLPCQPFSAIGKRKGKEDERNLWPVFARLVRSCRPVWIFGEQVSSRDGLAWIDGVFDDLEDAGYTCAAVDLCAAGIGAPHIRQRLYWLGYASGPGLEGYPGHGVAVGQASTHGSHATPSGRRYFPARMDAVSVLRRLPLHDPWTARRGLHMPAGRRLGGPAVWDQFDALPCVDGWRRVRSGAFPLAAGLSARVVRLRGYGNSLVPQLAATFIRCAVEAAAEKETAPGFKAGAAVRPADTSAAAQRETL